MQLKMFNIDVVVHWSWWALMVIVPLRDLIALDFTEAIFKLWLISCLGGLVLMHELAHALMGRKFGVSTNRIYLHFLGGAAMMNFGRTTDREDFLIAVAGPLSNFVLGWFLWPLAILTQSNFLIIPFAVSWLMGGFNLIPAYPMDGGRIARALLHQSGVTRRKATGITQGLSCVFAVLFVLGGLYIGAPLLALIGLFLFGSVWWERRGRSI